MCNKFNRGNAVTESEEGPVGKWENCWTVTQVLKAGPGMKEQGKEGRKLR